MWARKICGGCWNSTKQLSLSTNSKRLHERQNLICSNGREGNYMSSGTYLTSCISCADEWWYSPCNIEHKRGGTNAARLWQNMWKYWTSATKTMFVKNRFVPNAPINTQRNKNIWMLQLFLRSGSQINGRISSQAEQEKASSMASFQAH